MSIVIRERYKIKMYDSDDEHVEKRIGDMFFDHMDDFHVRIEKLFPLCTEDREVDVTSYKRFHLRFYVPLAVYQDKYKKIDKCFIMFNGLDEIDYFTLYDQIGKGLCKNGYGAILLPLPDHLNRNPQYRFNSFENRRRPSESFIKEPQKIYEAYLQVIEEVKLLVPHLQGYCSSGGYEECCHFFSQFFAKNVRISLLGYSLGGLAALSNFLIQDYEFNSCILINAGAKLSDIDVSEFQSESKWARTVRNLAKAHYELDKRDERHRLFNMLFLGNDLGDLKEVLKEKSRKILFVIGGADSVTKFKTIRQIEPEKHGLAILKIPGIHHFLSVDTHWDQWFPIVNDIIKSFDDSSGNESLLPNDILGSLSYFQLKYRVSDRLDHYDMDRIEDQDEKDIFERTLFAAKGTYGSIGLSFIEMYKLVNRANKRPRLYPDYTLRQYRSLLGTIAKANCGMQQSALDEALKEQENIARSGEPIPYIGEILVEKGYLTRDDVGAILLKQDEMIGCR